MNSVNTISSSNSIIMFLCSCCWTVWLTLIVDTAVLILLSCHESVNLSLCHLLSCRGRQRTSDINNTQSDSGTHLNRSKETHPRLTHRVLTGQYAAQHPSLCRCPPCRRRADPQHSLQILPCLGCWWWPGAWAGSPQTLLSCWPCLRERR